MLWYRIPPLKLPFPPGKLSGDGEKKVVIMRRNHCLCTLMPLPAWSIRATMWAMCYHLPRNTSDNRINVIDDMVKICYVSYSSLSKVVSWIWLCSMLYMQNVQCQCFTSIQLSWWGCKEMEHKDLWHKQKQVEVVRPWMEHRNNAWVLLTEMHIM